MAILTLNPGTYVLKHKDNQYIIKVSGIYPNIKIESAISIDEFFANPMKTRAKGSEHPLVIELTTCIQQCRVLPISEINYPAPVQRITSINEVSMETYNDLIDKYISYSNGISTSRPHAFRLYVMAQLKADPGLAEEIERQVANHVRFNKRWNETNRFY